MFEGIFQPMHLIIILVIALVVFGPGKLPELGSGDFGAHVFGQPRRHSLVARQGDQHRNHARSSRTMSGLARA